MSFTKEIRRQGIMLRKRIGLMKYNFGLKREVGAYNPRSDIEMTEDTVRSVNMFDFNNKSDVYLMDNYSDSSEFGGESESSFSIMKDEDYDQ